MLNTISRLPLRLMRAMGRLLGRTLRLALAGSALTLAVFILDAVLLRDPQRPDEPKA